LAIRAGIEDEAGIVAGGFAVDDVHQLHIAPRVRV
jgi:hypothetical protein